jgi:Recombination endonuclease VII
MPYTEAYRVANAEAIKAYHQSYRKRNRELLLAKKREWRRNRRNAAAEKELERVRIESERAEKERLEEKRRILSESYLDSLRKIQDAAPVPSVTKKRRTSEEGRRGDARRARLRKLRRLGLREMDLSRLFDSQKGRCAICSAEFDKLPKTRRHVDHCHRTCRVRGLLCNRCNSLLGFAGDDISILRNAIRYLEAAAVQPGFSSDR